MVYDPGAQTGSLGVSLVTGVMSFVSGEIAKVDPDAMVLKTPLATIGIRGTAGSIDNTQTLTVVLTREGDGTVGEITVTTQGGVQVLNSPFQGTQVTDANAPPTQTFTMTPEQFQQQFGQSVQAMNDTLTETGQQTLPPPTADDGNQQDGEAGDIAPESADDQGPGDGPPAEFRPEQFQEFFDAQL
jgi:flagellar hook-associated protein FlgK